MLHTVQPVAIICPVMMNANKHYTQNCRKYDYE